MAKDVAQDVAKDGAKAVESLADGHQATDDADQFDTNGYPLIFKHVLCAHDADASDAKGYPQMFKRFVIAHATDISAAKEEAASKKGGKYDMIGATLAPINPNVRSRKLANNKVAKAREEEGLEQKQYAKGSRANSPSRRIRP